MLKSYGGSGDEATDYLINFTFVPIMSYMYMQLASDAGAVVSMTESEKKRLEELLCDDNELEVSKTKL